MLRSRDVARDGLGADVGEIARDRRERNRIAVRDMNARIRVRVGIRETLPVAALGERGEGQATVSASRGTDVETLHVLER